MNDGKLARNEDGEVFMRCRVCGATVPDNNQRPRPCRECLDLWLEKQGVPFMQYVQEGEE